MGDYQQPHVPNSDDKFVPAENNGALLLIFPTQVQTGITTKHGEADAVHAKIVRLNDGRVWENAMIFPTALVNQTRHAVPDGMVLGTLGQGNNTKGSAPWILLPHTAEDEAKADAWRAANPVQQYAQPAQQQAAAPQWGGAPTPSPAAPAWGAPASPASPAPATGGWGAPAPQDAAPQWGAQQAQTNTASAGWGAPAPAAPSAPAAPAPAPSPAAPAWGAPPAPQQPTIDPGLVEALRKKGVNVPPTATQQEAEQAWAIYQNQPDVA